MKCTDKEWDHCRVEKMGCRGCYYSEMEENIKEDVEILNKLLDNDRLHRKYRNPLIEIMNEVNKRTCTYKQLNDDYNTWECSNCKCDWCIEDGTPKDNNMNYCPECGARIKKIIEHIEEED